MHKKRERETDRWQETQKKQKQMEDRRNPRLFHKATDYCVQGMFFYYYSLFFFSNLKIFPGFYISQWVAAKAASPPPWQPHARLKTEEIAHNQTVDIHCGLNQTAGPEEYESVVLTCNETQLPPAYEQIRVQVQHRRQNFFNESPSKLTEPNNMIKTVHLSSLIFAACYFSC